MVDDLGVTRKLLENRALNDLVTKVAPDVVLWTDAQRAENLKETLAANPADEIWVFAYGSLIWNPTIAFEEHRIAVVHGWHRSFCLSVSAGRGTMERPGLVLGLDQGGDCTGVAFRLDKHRASEELDLLWRREMLAGAYKPSWLELYSESGDRLGSGIAFVIDASGPHYTGNLSKEQIVLRLATASGFLGSSADYLFQTIEGLRKRGVVDKDLEELGFEVLETIARFTEVQKSLL